MKEALIGARREEKRLVLGTSEDYFVLSMLIGADVSSVTRQLNPIKDWLYFALDAQIL